MKTMKRRMKNNGLGYNTFNMLHYTCYYRDCFIIQRKLRGLLYENRGMVRKRESIRD